MVTDKAVECTVVFLDLEPSRKWCPHRVARTVEHKDREGRHQVIEEPMPRRVTEWRPFRIFIPPETPVRDHLTESEKRFSICDRFSHGPEST